MEKNNFYFILGSRYNGRLSAQREYLERAYEKKRKKEQASLDEIAKIIRLKKKVEDIIKDYEKE